MRPARRARPDGNATVTRALRSRGDSAAAGLSANVPDAPARRSRRTATLFALALLVVVLVALVVETPGVRAGEREPAVVSAIRAEFGAGELGGCFVGIAWRESRYNPRAANWTDRHADGSRGSFGALQIGALWRRRGESVPAFARRMFDPAANARLAHRIYRRYGLAPWGSSCS